MARNRFERSYKDTLPVIGVKTRESSCLTPIARVKGMLAFNCDYCDLPILKHWRAAARAARHFCSHDCASKARRVRIKCSCEICGTEFEVIHSNVGKIVTCSRRCLKEKRRRFLNKQVENMSESPIFNFGKHEHTPRKLTEAQVKSIYKDQRKQAVISEEYKISQQMVSQIKQKKTWAHV